ncbi:MULTISPECIES: LacI family DNA-binding transcriptional regulator [unclassified Fusibacter]|uniref:LacI family DNA-binding transcriptional regulator n=1 Tax=unclassified Fusibacter TaxID=2624464 RepID=UPI0010108B04|nr:MULTISPECIES: LacI family DNA-binding transcriptional regulator [unclassified Fusibacter]MCK8060225.1 LacI family transcriptional regulator [Fusibacter sp. A2]NPE22364.1 LacI family transcriptional regulator [Fusibacter sp. A1]RXV61136.1 LacI family transcriptional regulator [Fusibacter sp. A1]
MRVSIYDVAEKAGLSVVTVSRVLNNASTVRESSRIKVMKAVKELNYQPSAAARSLAKGKTNVIGIILPNLSDSFLSEVVMSANIALEKYCYSLAVSVADDGDLESKERGNSFFQQDRFDGVLVLTPIFDEGYLESLKQNRVPFVIIDNQRYPFTVPSVVVDNFKGGYEATKYLIEAGHELIAHVGGPESLLSAEERMAGFNKAIEEVGIEAYGVIRGDFEISTGYDAMCEWLAKGRMPTAIFAGDDNIAFGVIDALREHGLKVPEDVSVIGYDDHPFCSKLHPFLTTVKQPAKELAEEAVEMLLKVMSNNLKKNMIVKLEPQLIIRSSVKNL